MWKKSNLIQKIKGGFSSPTFSEEELAHLTIADCHIREAQYTDINRLRKIQKEVYEGVIPWTREIFLHEFNGPNAVAYFVVEYNGTTIGFSGVRVIEDNAHITNVAIYPMFQSIGLGTALIKKMIDFSQKQECATMTLEVRMSNTRAQKLYRRFGFFPKELKHTYYSDGEDAILMCSRLKEG